MPRRYNLRTRDNSVKWVEDETLKDQESESEDEDYVPPSEDEESEDVSLAEEDEEEDDEKSEGFIRVPLPKKGMRVKIEIENGYESEYDDEEEEEEDEDEFVAYLMNKYVPASKVGQKKEAKKTVDEPAIELNDTELEYFDELPKSKKKKLNAKMKQLSTFLKDDDVPHKFRILDLPIPDSVKAMVVKKIDLLTEMEGEGGGESHKLRNWVDGFMRIPFGQMVPLPVKISDGPVPCAEFLSKTRKTLDSAVYGMNAAKTQVMQILAQWISNPGSIGNVIALRGPMGTGKTQISKNGIARVLQRPFAFFSLGGASDSANFLGHSYTYEGSTWGRIVDSLMSARCMNPVMYFDELDKISTTAHGEEIVNMLIHMTDRSQNSHFHDRYYAGIDFDLSQCLFVFSFNDESKVNPILRDRMQVIQCPGYSAEEKKIIVTQYVWPQILERIQLKDVEITNDAIKYLISEHSNEEEGVRTLMRAVETLLTRINLLRIADEETAKSYVFYKKIELPCVIDADLAKHILQDNVKTTDESWRRLYT